MDQISGAFNSFEPGDPHRGFARRLLTGDPFPWIKPRARHREKYVVDSSAGRYLVLCFFGSASLEAAQKALNAAHENRDLFFGPGGRVLFGVSVDPQDEEQKRISDAFPGVVLWDFDGKASQQCGVLEGKKLDPQWIIVDPTLHVLAVYPFRDITDHSEVFAFLRSLPPAVSFAGFEIPAPVLVLPNVLEQELCRELIQLYDRSDARESGVMRNGAMVLDNGFKRRSDVHIEDSELRGRLAGRITRRVVPELRKLFFIKITRMERYIVGCYAAEDGGHFRPHRDNNPGVTAHRRFAISINLNADFEGGAVSFPEYNPRGIKAPPGWAVVFPCAILHAVSEVTSGRRYAFLPFVYDEEGAKIRAANPLSPPDPPSPPE